MIRTVFSVIESIKIQGGLLNLENRELWRNQGGLIWKSWGTFVMILENQGNLS